MKRQILDMKRFDRAPLAPAILVGEKLCDSGKRCKVEAYPPANLIKARLPPCRQTAVKRVCSGVTCLVPLLGAVVACTREAKTLLPFVRIKLVHVSVPPLICLADRQPPMRRSGYACTGPFDREQDQNGTRAVA